MLRFFLRLSAVLLFAAGLSYAQNVKVTFHFDPPVDNFQTVRMAGTFNNWNNDDNDWTLSDDDMDGVYEITRELSAGSNIMYKFVLDADWGQAYTDPDNPEFNVNDNNNSEMSIRNPMVVYMLPRGVNSADEMYVDTSEEGEPIRVMLGLASGVQVMTMNLSIDGVAVDNPMQYYNAATQELSYHTNLENGEHTVNFSTVTSAGFVSKGTTFIRNTDFVENNYVTDFYFDSNNSRYSSTQITETVALMGTFNGWNNQMNPMEDEDGDGVFHGTAKLDPEEYEYKFQLNGGIWLNDFDNINFTNDQSANNLIDVSLNTKPTVHVISPKPGITFTEASLTYSDTLKLYLRRGTGAESINESTIVATVDDASASYEFNSDDNMLKIPFTFTGDGVHSITLAFENSEGESYSGSFNYLLEAEHEYFRVPEYANDEIYTYPSGVADGAADITFLKIEASENYDALNFTVEMRNIDDRTRLGLMISNHVTAQELAPKNLELLLPDWESEGFFISIAPPQSQYLNQDRENRFQLSREPETFTEDVLQFEGDPISSDVFKFSVSTALMDSVMGSWALPRDIALVAYIADTDGSGNAYEVTTAENGAATNIDADVYDDVFIRDPFWQKKILSNYILSGVTFGPLETALDLGGRGIYELKASDISDSLAASGPVLTVLTPGTEYWYENITVHGEINDSAITSVTAYFNGETSEVSVSDNKYSIDVTLIEGENEVYFTAVDGEGHSSKSKTIKPVFVKDHEPTVTVETNVSGRTVNLTANGVSPDNLGLTYSWEVDEASVAPLSLNASGNIASVEMPTVAGEYLINIKVTDTQNRVGKARRLIYADSDTVYVHSGNDHPAWVDSAIVYEIFPRSFSEQGGFNGITANIQNIVDLGVNTVWLMPVFTGNTDHGYAITNYFGLEEDYGTEQDFIDMVDAFHEKGIRVVLDWVVNHTAIEHRFMQNVFSYKQYSPYADFYLWSGTPGESSYEYFYDWASLPNLNVANEDVQDYFIGAAEYWIKNYNIDGLRCDVAWGVEQRSTTYWQKWRERLKNINPDIFLLAEANHEATFYNKKFDSAYDWETMHTLIGVYENNNTVEQLNNTLMVQGTEKARPFRCIENHDEQRIMDRFDKTRSIGTHAVLFTSRGIPLIYAGAEVGETSQRELIDWSDQEDMLSSFKRLCEIKNKYVRNPEIQRVTNTIPADVYSYASISGEHILITAVNFRNEPKTISMNLSSIALNGTGIDYLTDMFYGNIVEVSESNVGAVTVTLPAYTTKIFAYSDEVLPDDIEMDEPTVVKEYALKQNYPNPFNPSTTIEYSIPETNKVTIKVYDLLGQEVATLVNEVKNAGAYKVTFNASNLASSIYFYRIESGSFTDVKKLVLLK